MKKSICFISPQWITYNIGGSELQLYLISERLINNGWKIEVITKKSNNILNLNYYNLNIRYIYYKTTKIKVINFIAILCLLFKTRSYYYFNRSDARLLRGACGLFLRFSNRKFIYSIASDEEIEKRKYASVYLKRKRRIKNGFLFLDSFILDKLINLSRKPDLVFVQTIFQKEMLLKNLGIEAVLLRNSIDYKKSKDVVKENIVIWVGNLRKVKRPEIFIDLVRVCNLSDWKYYIIGEIDEYSHLVHSNSFSNVHYLGSLDLEKTEAWFKKAKILINTSLYEGFSNTFIQAWIYKVQLISLIVDPDQFLSQRGWGMHCNGDIDKLKESLVNSYRNRDEKRLLEIKQKAMQVFNLSRNVLKIVKYLQLIN